MCRGQPLAPRTRQQRMKVSASRSLGRGLAWGRGAERRQVQGYTVRAQLTSTRTQQAATGPSHTLRNRQEVAPGMAVQGPLLSGLARDKCQVPRVLGNWRSRPSLRPGIFRNRAGAGRSAADRRLADASPTCQAVLGTLQAFLS